jgi:hypothetical protein
MFPNNLETFEAKFLKKPLPRDRIPGAAGRRNGTHGERGVRWM